MISHELDALPLDDDDGYPDWRSDEHQPGQVEWLSVNADDTHPSYYLHDWIAQPGYFDRCLVELSTMRCRRCDIVYTIDIKGRLSDELPTCCTEKEAEIMRVLR